MILAQHEAEALKKKQVRILVLEPMRVDGRSVREGDEIVVNGFDALILQHERRAKVLLDGSQLLPLK